MTRVFSGRSVRGIVTAAYDDLAPTPPVYPHINDLTKPLRAAGSRMADRYLISAWAGQGYQHTRTAAAAEIIRWLGSEIEHPTMRANQTGHPVSKTGRSTTPGAPR